jgi:hypothetical protein
MAVHDGRLSVEAADAMLETCCHGVIKTKSRVSSISWWSLSSKKSPKQLAGRNGSLTGSGGAMLAC